ncbi:hypothetical protein PTSG_11353 [Salpingoeca rosetta]|uniref:Uncharacterized protein n=1 Tax=Salpingoeca rosetta (strain ATCC 50818 / BSB-021) TaxID=946362 RepID=F2UT58_SALR5|nr:uncharacterized protein PTSG_11353 [Salpingoeca rosetta]EGD81317.1 hypothetical protein PTSG_11353 [Salpingoeca rosetta]|eukprot:XP_004987713.1 hypothetical protein PTSG_11353 [Salpingoeca rosetta]
MKLFVLAVLAACVAASAALTIPARCQSPKQFYGQVFAFEQHRSERGEVQGDYFYDETNMRKARYERAHVNGSNYRLHIIELFNEKKYYEINLDTDECRSGDLTAPFIPHGVVRNATFRGDFIVGTSAIEGAGVEIELWTHEFQHEGHRFYWTGEFTRVACVPVRTTVQGEQGEFFTESFVDVVGGIPDPNAFVVPSSCN